MKCPCCGNEMVMDGHTKVDKFMCYECGYVEGRMVPARAAAPVKPVHSGINFKVFGNFTWKNRLAEAFAKFLKKLSVLCSFNCFKISAEYFNVTFLKHAFFSELNCKVKTCLSAEC